MLLFCFNMIAEAKVQALIKAIKKKKELGDVDDRFVRKELFVFFKHNQKILNALTEKFNSKSTHYRVAVKKVREKLRRVYGLFQKNKGLDQGLVVDDIKNNEFTSVLCLHSSTRERIVYYKELYSKIFKITGEPKVIVDLGCGLNPFSLSFMNLNKVKYYAYDVNQKQRDLLNLFFEKLKQGNKYFNGVAAVLDLLNLELLEKLPKADVAFLFKVLDVLDQNKSHKSSERVIKTVPARFIITSFATRTMSGKRMTAPKRKWMEWLCRRLGYKYTLLKFDNEIFYVIEKK